MSCLNSRVWVSWKSAEWQNLILYLLIFQQVHFSSDEIKWCFFFWTDIGQQCVMRNILLAYQNLSLPRTSNSFHFQTLGLVIAAIQFWVKELLISSWR